MQISDKQLAANRRNAQLSTGPRTAEGKAVVSLNALTHGLRSRRVLLPDEDPAEFEKLCDTLTAEWEPQTPTEGHFVTQIAVALWKLDRLDSLETHGDVEMIIREGGIATRIWQQQARLERSKASAIAHLERLRKARQAEPKAEPKVEPEPEAIEAPEPQPKPPQTEYVMHAGSALPAAEAAPDITGTLPDPRT